jgi:hypothetical protein
MSHIKRKPTRLKEYDYSTPAYLFRHNMYKQ